MAMDKVTAESYVYAKASGMLSKSYVGERARQLFAQNSLQELWNFLFKKESPAVPETLLARELEREAFDSFVGQYKTLLANYSKPHNIYLYLLQSYDFENLKDIGAALALGKKNMPDVEDISPFNIISYDKWPDIKAMTQTGSLSWYSVPELAEQHLENSRLDSFFIENLWKSLDSVNPECKSALKNLIGKKIRIDNTVWAIRLRFYYGMSKEEIIPLLSYSDKSRKPGDVLAQEAISTLDWDLDDYDTWSKWKHADLLNPHEEGVVWTVDSRWITQKAKNMYVEKAYRLFHIYPFTECPLVCWFIVKRNELDNIRTASESLRLNIGSSQAMNLAGFSEVSNG